MCDTGPVRHPEPGRLRGAFRTRGGRDWHWLSCRLSSSGWTRCGRCWRAWRSPRSRRGSGCTGRRCIGGWPRYLAEQIGWVGGSFASAGRRVRIRSAEAVEVAVAEMRRKHPRWGSRRIRMELLRRPPVATRLCCPVGADHRPDPDPAGPAAAAAAEAAARVLVRRFERPGPMQLWGIDIVGGVSWSTPCTGVLREAKVVTGVDDHSRFCVIAAVVERATGRAVCLALAEALARFGVPEEVITDNGKQFTDRFGKGGEVLFDKICRRNGITHLLTAAGVTEPERQGGAVPRHPPARLPRRRRPVRPAGGRAGRGRRVGRATTTPTGRTRPWTTSVPVTPARPVHPGPASRAGLVELWLPPALDVAEPHPATDRRSDRRIGRG